MNSGRRHTTETRRSGATGWWLRSMRVLLSLVLVGVWPMEGLAKTTGGSAKTTGGHKSTHSSSATSSKPKASSNPGSPEVGTATPSPVRLLDDGMRAGGASSLLSHKAAPEKFKAK
jgi:hypothetical protein